MAATPSGAGRASSRSLRADFTDLGHDQQRQYAAFVEIAACQVCVDTVNMTDLLAATGEQQAALIQVADDVLTLAQRDVEALV